MATGTSRTVSAPVFHDNDAEQTTEYRTLSVLAILSLVIGLISPVAIAGPFLLVIPFVGIAVSLIALRRIAVSGGALAGRWAAIVGLVLSVASAVVPISHNLVQRAIRTQQAEAFGRSWVEMVTSGNLEQAFHLTVDATRPAAPAEPGAPPQRKPFDLFREHPIIKALQAVGPTADIRIRETVDFQVATYRNLTIRQLYTVSPASTASAGASAKPIEFVLSVQRGMIPRENMSRWMVTNFAEQKTSADSSLKR